MISFKTPDLAEQIEKCDPRISVILLSVALYLQKAKPPRTLMVTSVLRTAQEQERIYAKATSLGKQEPATSPHQFGRAVDISVLGWPADLIPAVVDHINTRFPYHGLARYRSALAHDVGLGNHIHIQVAAPVLTWEKMK